MNETAQKPALPFSDAILHGGLWYISGQIGIDPATGRLATAPPAHQPAGDVSTGLFADSGFAAEARQVMINLGAVLRKYGLDYRDLISVTIYLTGMDYYGVTNEVYRQYFKDRFPARVCVAVKELPLHASIEIAGIAASGAGGIGGRA